MKIQKKKKTPRTVFVVMLIVAFILAGGASYWYLDTNGFFGHSDNETPKQSGNNTADDNDITDDTTIDDKKGNDDKPPIDVDETGKKVAQIVIVDASQYGNTFEVRAGITNLTEENGRCEFIFTQNGLELIRTSDAIFTGTGTDCQTLEIPIKNFPAKGKWEMVVKYTSVTASGSSQTKTVMVE
jgi:hypothetical protein